MRPIATTNPESLGSTAEAIPNARAHVPPGCFALKNCCRLFVLVRVLLEVTLLDGQSLRCRLRPAVMAGLHVHWHLGALAGPDWRDPTWGLVGAVRLRSFAWGGYGLCVCVRPTRQAATTRPVPCDEPGWRWKSPATCPGCAQNPDPTRIAP